jgi:hypothetical protein
MVDEVQNLIVQVCTTIKFFARWHLRINVVVGQGTQSKLYIKKKKKKKKKKTIPALTEQYIINYFLLFQEKN